MHSHPISSPQTCTSSHVSPPHCSYPTLSGRHTVSKQVAPRVHTTVSLHGPQKGMQEEDKDGEEIGAVTVLLGLVLLLLSIFMDGAVIGVGTGACEFCVGSGGT
jgi:hypothetical protein